ncbi:MAG: hypothetical protein QW087_01370 [Methanomassiliicoccales archaeon]
MRLLENQNREVGALGFGGTGICWPDRKIPKIPGNTTQLLECCFYQGVENAEVRRLLKSGALLFVRDERELSLEARP